MRIFFIHEVGHCLCVGVRSAIQKLACKEANLIRRPRLLKPDKFSYHTKNKH